MSLFEWFLDLFDDDALDDALADHDDYDPLDDPDDDESDDWE